MVGWNKIVIWTFKSTSITSNAVNGTVLSDVDLAVAINESFCSVADDMPQLNFTPISVPNIPEEFIITRDAVEAALLSVQNRKAIGPDEIPNWLLKTCASTISLPVCSMFNSSIREGHVPRLWKSAAVLPLRKIPRPKSIDTDLRPISLTAALSKILESFVFNWLAPIVMPYIDPFQFGSVKKSSTTHALVHLVHYCLSALEISNTIIRTCFIDFSKAFDLIDHHILMHKLQLLNVPPVLLNWCSSFLQNRQQRVTLRTCKSNWKEIKAGVPQGTKLGPLFFLIMVNDLSSELVSSTNNVKLNVKRTKNFTVSFLHSQPSVEPLIVDNQTLEVVNTFKLLGVYLTSDLKWTTHVRHISSKASKRLYALRILKRNGVQPSYLKTVYCSFIKPVVEYACLFWHTSLPKFLIDELEHIQKRALKIIVPHLSYFESLIDLKLPTLEERRELLCRSFYENNYSDTSSKISHLLPEPLDHQYRLRYPRSIPLFNARTKRYNDSFLPYCVRKWNSF